MLHVTEHHRLFVYYVVDVNVWKSYYRLVKLITYPLHFPCIVMLYGFILEVLTYNYRVFLLEPFEIWGFFFW